MARRRALARVSGRSQQFPAGDALALAGALDEAAIITLASAAAVAIGAAQANTIQISGTTTITSFDTVASGAVRRLVFSGALTLTHNSTKLILPGAANITTAAGDSAIFVSLGGGNWRCVGYQLASSVGGGSSSVLTKYFESAQQTITTSSSLTISHGLGSNPKIVSAYLICISAVSGYAVGDMLEFSPSYQYVGSTGNSPSAGISVTFDASNLYVAVSITGISIVNKSNYAQVQPGIVASNFKMVFRAMT